MTTVILDTELLRIRHALKERADKLRGEGYKHEAMLHEQTLAKLSELDPMSDYRLQRGRSDVDAPDGFMPED